MAVMLAASKLTAGSSRISYTAHFAPYDRPNGGGAEDRGPCGTEIGKRPVSTRRTYLRPAYRRDHRPESYSGLGKSPIPGVRGGSGRAKRRALTKDVPWRSYARASRHVGSCLD